MVAKHKIALTCVTFLAGLGLVLGTPHDIPPAFGPYLHPVPADFHGAKSFQAGDRIVGTYYFYWYDYATKTHVINDGLGTDALTDHPATFDDFSWKSVTWHKKQLTDMEDAGIDVALMVFWGAPSEHEPASRLYWSFDGLKPLVAARDELLREGHHPPALGLFYDTSTLANNSWNEHIDLTTDYGKRWFYATVRDFFSCIPARHWAMMNGQPIMLMYAAAFAQNYDQSFIDYTRRAFPADFGGRSPYIAPQDSWQVRADTDCIWGGALGLKRAGIDELGPGYDHSAVPGRAPLIVQREGGKFYENNWLKFLRHPSNFVMLETWSEFHEGTDICESREYGRQYIDLTRKYTRLFKQGWKPPAPAGPFNNAAGVAIILGRQNHEQGLRLIEAEDGRTEPAVAGGSPARRLAAPPSRFMYFAADDSFKWADSMRARLEVEYFDAGRGTLGVEYDGSDLGAPFRGAYTKVGTDISLTGAGGWKTARFELTGARFLNSENGGADFRIDIADPSVCIRRVALRRE